MGTFREIKGDLLNLADKGEFDIIAHGCNCQKAMGAGIAWAIATKHPIASLVDKRDTRIPIERLGDMSIAHITNVDNTAFSILNLYTQLMPGKNLSYEALALCLFKLNIMFAGLRIGLPLIGCGIAGGDWQTIKSMIQKSLTDCDVTIVHFALEEKGKEEKEIEKGAL